MRHHSRSRRAGLTLFELMIALVLLGLLFHKALIVIEATSEASGDQTNEVLLQDKARETVTKIAYALMSSSRETLDYDAPPGFDSDEIGYEINLGIQDGEVVWGDPEHIGVANVSQLTWRQNPDAESERQVVWSNLVAPYLEGEIPNGMDDNGNGIIDEKGLSFVMNGDAITVRLSLDRPNADGELITETVQTTVTCRNVQSEQPGA